MRIAYFTDTFMPEVNGVTNTLAQLQKYLASSEHEYMFYAPSYPSVDGDDAHIHRFVSLPFPLYKESRLSIPHYGKLHKHIAHFKPDIIHVVTPIGIGHAGLRYAKEHHIPLVASFHTNFDTYLNYYNLTHLEPLLWSFFKNFHNQFEVNFAPSSDTLTTLAEQGIEHLEIWARGIDTAQFSPHYRDATFFDNFRKRPKNKKISCLYTGRLAAEKDLDILFESIAILNQRYRDDIEFILVGDGPEKDKLAARAIDNVYFTGFLRGEALAKAYASADIFTFPSSTETLGNVVLEAMASGTAVVAVAAGGITDNVTHNYNGLLATPRNAADFSAKIGELIEQSSRRHALRENALNFVKARTWSSIFDKLMRDYQTVLCQSGTVQRDIKTA